LFSSSATAGTPLFNVKLSIDLRNERFWSYKIAVQFLTIKEKTKRLNFSSRFVNFLSTYPKYERSDLERDA